MYDIFNPFDIYSNLIFIEKDDSHYNYAEFFQLIKERASKLSTNKLFLNDDIIPIMLENEWDFILNIFATWYVGKTPVLLSTDHSHQIQKLSHECGFNLELLSLLTKDSGSPVEGQPLPEKAIIVLSSGTEGLPKCIVHSFEGLFLSAKGSIEFYNMSKEDSFPLTISPHHIGGLMIILRACLSGGSITLKRTHWKEILEKRHTFISLVPKQLNDILNDAKLLAWVKDARAIILGGAPLSKKIFLKAIHNGLKLSLSYGSTETCAQILATHPESQDFNLGAPLPYRNFSLDQNNNILIEGPCLFTGIYQDGIFVPRKETIYRPKDHAFVDLNKNIYGIERLDEMINSGGKKISPFEIKEFVLSKNIIEDIEIFKCFDKKWGEVPVAAILVDQNKSIEHLYQDLPDFKKPKHTLRLESFPKKGLKIDKQILKRMILLSYLKEISDFSFQYYQMSPNNHSPLLIYLHGFMGDQNEHFFENRGYDILSFDLPGHGETSLQAFTHFNDVIEKLSHCFNILGQEKIIFYGYSMGGRILASCLEKIQVSTNQHRYFFESTHVGLESESEKEKRLLHDKNIATNLLAMNNLKDYDIFLAKWYDSDIFITLNCNPSYKNFIAAKLKDLTIEKVHHFGQALMLLSLGHQNSIQFNQNSHFFLGSLDQKFLAIYQNSQLENINIVEGCSHNIHLSHAEILLKHIKTVD